MMCAARSTVGQTWNSRQLPKFCRNCRWQRLQKQSWTSLVPLPLIGQLSGFRRYNHITMDYAWRSSEPESFFCRRDAASKPSEAKKRVWDSRRPLTGGADARFRSVESLNSKQLYGDLIKMSHAHGIHFRDAPEKSIAL
jgi:hypothetical protein